MDGYNKGGIILRILYGLLLFFSNIIFCFFRTFKKIVLAIAMLLLFCFFYTIFFSHLFSNATFLERILFIICYLIIPTFIMLLYKPSEKLFSLFTNFLSNRFCSYLSNEELYYQNKTSYSKTSNDSSDYTSESSYSEQEYYSDYTDSDAASEQYDSSNTGATINLFSGVNNLADLKKRYRDLLKIYHPDNLAGDETMTKQIQAECEHLLEYYSDKT